MLMISYVPADGCYDEWRWKEYNQPAVNLKGKNLDTINTIMQDMKDPYIY